MKPHPQCSVSHADDVGNGHQLSRGFQPYTTYKDSGIPWLGSIPSHWKVMRLKSLASVHLSNVDKKSVDDQVPVRLCNYVDVYYHDHVTSQMDFMEATATPDQVHQFSLMEADVLITKDSEKWNDIAVPSVVAEDLPGVLCGYHMAHIKPCPECHGPFLSRAFSAIGLRDQYHVAANGITRFGLTRDAIRDGLFPLPSYPEQQSIASFLDRETAKIDALVAKKKRLIELLTERRNALITRTVITGLDPSAPMKIPGLDYVRKIPLHWRVKRLKYLVSEPLSYGANEPADSVDPDQPRYIRITDICDDGTLNDDTYRTIPISLASGYLLNDGDILLARSGATVGKAFRYSSSWGAAAFAGYLIRARVEERHITSDLAYYFTQSDPYRHWLLTTMIQSTIQNVSAERYATLKIPLGSLHEQRRIVSFLDRETAKIDDLIARIGEAIDRMEELRTALISAAVTGKIDVRKTTA